MSPQTNLDRSKVSLLHFWHSGLRSPTEIARKCKLPVSTVAYNLKKLRSTHSLKHRGKNGRKRLVGTNASRTIGQMIRRNKEVTAFQIATRLEQEEGTNVSCWTVRRHLRRMGYVNTLPRRKPMLTEEQRRQRLSWALAHKDDDWSRTVFSDETSIQLFRNTVRRWSKDPRSEVKRVPKCRQKIMVWGGISTQGTIGLCLFQGIMDAKRYIDILQKNLLPASRRLFGNDWRLQQDRDPKHTARVTKKFLSENVPAVLDWPANSPDLNPIENVWAVIKKRVEKKRPVNLSELQNLFMDEWLQMDKGFVIQFLQSMKSRCEAVIAANGNHIKF